MSKYIFTVETEDLDELDVYQKAHANSYIVFELLHNFHRNFRHIDGESDDFHKGVNCVLNELERLIEDHYE